MQYLIAAALGGFVMSATVHLIGGAAGWLVGAAMSFGGGFCVGVAFRRFG